MPLPLRVEILWWLAVLTVSIARSRSMPLPPNNKICSSMSSSGFQSLGRAQCLCHLFTLPPNVPIYDCFNRSVALNASATPIGSNRLKLTTIEFQSLGRAQCLCHSDTSPLQVWSVLVSIARSRSMPLPPYSASASIPMKWSFNRSVALNASATEQ